MSSVSPGPALKTVLPVIEPPLNTTVPPARPAVGDPPMLKVMPVKFSLFSVTVKPSGNCGTL